MTGDPGRNGRAGIDVDTSAKAETEVAETSDRVRLVSRDRPFVPAGRLFVLYDAECGFCRSLAVHLRRWDRGSRLAPVPLQDAHAAGSRLLRAAAGTFDLAAEVTVVDEASGSASRGGDAILTLVDALPGGRVLRPAWSDRPFVWTIRAGYRIVARHRSRLAVFAWDAAAEAMPDAVQGHDTDPAAG